MRVHTNVTYGRSRYRVMGEVTPEGARILALEMEMADGSLVAVPSDWVKSLNALAQTAIRDAMRAAIAEAQKRRPQLTLIEGGRG